MESYFHLLEWSNFIWFCLTLDCMVAQWAKLFTIWKVKKKFDSFLLQPWHCQCLKNKNKIVKSRSTLLIYIQKWQCQCLEIRKKWKKPKLLWNFSNIFWTVILYKNQEKMEKEKATESNCSNTSELSLSVFGKCGKRRSYFRNLSNTF